MSTPYLRLSGPAAGSGSSVLRRRVGDLLRIGVTGLIPLVVALGIAIEMPRPNYLLILGVVVGSLCVVALMTSARYEVTVAILALYLGLLDGPVKLLSGGGTTASAVRDVLIFAVSLGAIMRLIASRERVRLPPLFGWVFAWIVLVVIEAFNPGTHGLLKVVGGFRQLLEWVPFFFFGYMIMRSKERLRVLFLLLGAIALANGLVSLYQTRISPRQLASWGPGYAQYVEGGKGFEGGAGTTGRTYSSEGVARVRPPALGSEEGFGGGAGTLALPGLLALLAVGRRRRRWLVVLLLLGALLAIGTSLQRTQVLGGVAAAVSFGLLSLGAGRRVTGPLAALLTVVVLAFAIGAVLVSAEGSGVFSRYASISPSNAGSTTVNYREKTILQIPRYIEDAPFGVGLATVGAGAGFGGKNEVELEGHGVTGESQYNFVTLELGVLGLILWVALTTKVILLAARRLRRIADIELRVYLVAPFAAFIAFTLAGFGGATTPSAVFGPFFWFATGIAAYWFAGPGRTASTSAAQPKLPAALRASPA
jgi:hypothetical protein